MLEDDLQIWKCHVWKYAAFNWKLRWNRKIDGMQYADIMISMISFSKRIFRLHVMFWYVLGMCLLFQNSWQFGILLTFAAESNSQRDVILATTKGWFYPFDNGCCLKRHGRGSSMRQHAAVRKKHIQHQLREVFEFTLKTHKFGKDPSKAFCQALPSRQVVRTVWMEQKQSPFLSCFGTQVL